LAPFAFFIACFFLPGCVPISAGGPQQVHGDGAQSGSSQATEPNIRFVDTTLQSGIDYRWSLPGNTPRNILQAIGNGCAFLDYNNDGNLDILLVGPKLALYKGDGHSHFTDVTHQTGLDKIHGNFLGCAVGDYDNDGYDDIYLTAYRGGELLHNEGGTEFKDVTRAAGIAPQPWGTSAGWADIDHSGRLSLYIGNYVAFGPKTDPQLCSEGGKMTSCGPRFYAPLRGVLYLNKGGGKFLDVTRAWGADKTSGKVLGVAFADINSSGRPSLYLANDEVAGDLLEDHSGSLVGCGATSGTAYDVNGGTHGGMGTDWGDYDNDGRLDLAVMTFQHEPKCVYHNDGAGIFSEESSDLGIAAKTTPNVSFGAKWLDVDNRGWLDLMIANGHIQDNIAQIDKTTSFTQPTQLFYNDHGRRFTDESAALVGPAARPIVGRGLAIGDFDNDGKVDALVVNSEGAPLLLHNETPSAGQWLEVDLVGTEDNRDGIGALVMVEADGLKQTRLCTTGGSYMSASSKRVHIGLGSAPVVDKLTVKWPSGHTDTYKNLRADQIITIKEGALAAIPFSTRE
jgi:hypothetical protein